VITKISLVPNSTVIYVDPSNPANTFDPDRGKNVTATDVYIYAQATAANGWGTQTAYGTQAIEVRDSPLFTNAIFYNMDLEFHPGANMSITGPIHANGNIWAVTQASLTFSGPITTSGNFNVGLMPWPTNWGSSSESSQSGKQVYIPNNSGGFTSPYIGGNLSQSVSSSYYDSRQTSYGNSTYSNWREMSSNLWGGNLQTSSNGVPNEQVTGYNNFVYQVNGTSQDMNYAYAIIEPAQSSYYANGTANPWNLQAGETDKFERNASLIVKVLALGTANITQTVTVPGNQTGSNIANLTSNIDSNTTVSSLATSNTSTVSSFKSSGNLVVGTNQTITGSVKLSNGTTQTISGNWTNPYASTNSTAVMLVTQNQQSSTSGGPALSSSLMELTPSASFNSTTNTTTGSTTRYVGFALVEFQTVQSAVNTTTNTLQPVYNGSTQVTDSYGDVTYPGDVTMKPIQVNSTLLTSSNVIWFQPAVGNMATGTNGTGNTSGFQGNISDVWNGLYDGRRGQTISTLNLDVGKLRNYVDNNISGFTANASAFFNGTGNTAFDPSSQYNGVVYVEFPEQAGNSTRLSSVTVNGTTYPGDQVLDSVDNTGLVLYDANTTTAGVPNPNYANTTAGTIGRVSGFTVGTNNCMYTLGSFNADGNLNTPKTDTAGNQTYNDTMPDNPASPDPAVCLAADSVTSLSGAWNSRVGKGSTYPAVASSTEVNAAILGGIVPSMKYSSTTESGGSHNFPRFLENWGGITFRYRGSMVCLYESEIANQAYSTSYYNAPTREWGFYNQFAKGTYPPGTPNARSYYRVNFTYLSKSVYTTDITGL
jgi:hypothetical protein